MGPYPGGLAFAALHALGFLGDEETVRRLHRLDARFESYPRNAEFLEAVTKTERAIRGKQERARGVDRLLRPACGAETGLLRPAEGAQAGEPALLLRVTEDKR